MKQENINLFKRYILGVLSIMCLLLLVAFWLPYVTLKFCVGDEPTPPRWVYDAGDIIIDVASKK